MIRKIIGWVCISGVLPALAENPPNLAPLASVSGPGQNPESAVDGIK